MVYNSMGELSEAIIIGYYRCDLHTNLRLIFILKGSFAILYYLKNES